MILGLGLDVVEVARLSRLLDGRLGERFRARVFTPAERAYCEDHAARAVHYAGRFAAKEALVKALGAPEGLRWRDMEVLAGGGAPQLGPKQGPQLVTTGRAALALAARGVRSVHLSLSHDGGLAAAVVVIEG